MLKGKLENENTPGIVSAVSSCCHTHKHFLHSTEQSSHRRSPKLLRFCELLLGSESGSSLQEGTLDFYARGRIWIASWRPSFIKLVPSLIKWKFTQQKWKCELRWWHGDINLEGQVSHHCVSQKHLTWFYLSESIPLLFQVLKRGYILEHFACERGE